MPQRLCVRLHSRAAALEFLRGFGSDREARLAMRQRLQAHRSHVERLSDEQVLDALAALLVSGRFVALRRADRPRPRRQKLPEKAVAAPPPKIRRDEKEEEAFVLAAELSSIGGTLLVNQPVRVIDPDTREVVLDGIETDDDGVLRTLVPENKTYRIEILDEAWKDPEFPWESDDRRGVLSCRFVDEAGAPLADLAVEATQGEQVSNLVTDADGWIESPANLGAYELRVGEQVFFAHAILPEDVAREGDAERTDETVRYEFVATGTAAADEQDESEEQDHRLERDHSWIEVAQESLGGIDLGDLDDLAAIAERVLAAASDFAVPGVQGVPDVPGVPGAPAAPGMPNAGVPDHEMPRPDRPPLAAPKPPAVPANRFAS